MIPSMLRKSCRALGLKTKVRKSQNNFARGSAESAHVSVKVASFWTQPPDVTNRDTKSVFALPNDS